MYGDLDPHEIRRLRAHGWMMGLVLGARRSFATLVT